MFKLISLFSVMILLFGNFSCSAQEDKESMTVSELKDAMKKDTSLVILDVRTPQELAGPLGKIDEVVNIPVQELESRISELDKYKNKNIAVICRTGHRSGIARKILTEHGIKSRNVKGGMTAWRELEK
ncbi:MAG: rhodanese-like domain-containing protein [Syntrophothermus sp.]